MQKLERKSEKAHERLDAAREKLPTHKVLKKERTFDEETGKGKTRLHFEDELKNVSCSSYHAAPSVVKIRRVWDYPNKQKSDVKGRVSLTDFSPVGTHRICLLFSPNRIPRRFLREMSLHFTTDIFWSKRRYRR